MSNGGLSGYGNGGWITPHSQWANAVRALSTLPGGTTSTPAKSNDFAGAPFDFALGEVYGMRMWHMDGYGRLRARNWNRAKPWRPGINVAKCEAESANTSLDAAVDPSGRGRKAVEVSVDYTYSGTSEFAVKWDDGQVELLAKLEFATRNFDHDTPSEDCQCGFYAYTDSVHAEVKSQTRNGVEPALGIIKGTGRTLIGTKGFRCEKAEIVGFRDPTRGGAKTDVWRVQQLANLRRVYPDVPILDNRAALLEFAPLTNTLPDPSTDEFWELP